LRRQRRLFVVRRARAAPERQRRWRSWRDPRRLGDGHGWTSYLGSLLVFSPLGQPHFVKSGFQLDPQRRAACLGDSNQVVRIVPIPTLMRPSHPAFGQYRLNKSRNFTIFSNKARQPRPKLSVEIAHLRASLHAMSRPDVASEQAVLY